RGRPKSFQALWASSPASRKLGRVPFSSQRGAAMYRHLLIAAVTWISLSGSARAEEALGEGNWRLSYAVNSAVENIDCILKVEKKDGKWTASLVAASPRVPSLMLDKFGVDGDRLRIVVKLPNGEKTFEGSLKREGKTIRGSYGDDSRLAPANSRRT